jgi:hypothetical protein
MGGCCSAAEDEKLEEVSNKMNEAIMCRGGSHGEKVKMKVDETKNIIRVSGSGTLIGSCSLDCDTAYWEVVVGQNPEDLRIGIKKYSRKSKEEDAAVLLSGDLMEDHTETYPSWSLSRDVVSYKEGDVVGVYWDQTDMPMLSFSLNGKKCADSSSVNRVRPAHDMFPAVSVKPGASCCVVFDGSSFSHPPNGKFGMIVCATSII